MMTNNDSVSDLLPYIKELGLSEYEANAYASLLVCGTSTAKQISIESDIPQSRIYDVLSDLETKGFVMVQQGRPKKYGPVDPERAIDQFCQYKRLEFDKNISQTRDLGNKLVQEAEDALSQRSADSEMDLGWYYNDREHVRENMSDLCANAESEILLITTAYSLTRLVNHHHEKFRESYDQGVDIKIALSNPDSLNDTIYQAVTDWASIRVTDDIFGRIYLYDDEDIVMAYQPISEDEEVGFTTKSAELYKTLRYFFDLIWRDGEPLQNHK